MTVQLTRATAGLLKNISNKQPVVFATSVEWHCQLTFSVMLYELFKRGDKMTWKVICGQQAGIGMEVTIDANGLNAIVNPDIQNGSIDVSWNDIDLPFIEDSDLSTQGIISFRIRNGMLFVTAESEENGAEEIAFPEDQLNWFKNKLEVYIIQISSMHNKRLHTRLGYSDAFTSVFAA